MSLPLANLSRRDEADRALDREVFRFRWAREALGAGEQLRPEDPPGWDWPGRRRRTEIPVA